MQAVVGILRGAPETLGIKPTDVTSTYLIIDPSGDPTTPDSRGDLGLRVQRLRQRVARTQPRRQHQAGQLPVLTCGPLPAETDVLAGLLALSRPDVRFGVRGMWRRIYRRDTIVRGVGPP